MNATTKEVAAIREPYSFLVYKGNSLRNYITQRKSSGMTIQRYKKVKREDRLTTEFTSSAVQLLISQTIPSALDYQSWKKGLTAQLMARFSPEYTSTGLWISSFFDLY